MAWLPWTVASSCRPLPGSSSLDSHKSPEKKATGQLDPGKITKNRVNIHGKSVLACSFLFPPCCFFFLSFLLPMPSFLFPRRSSGILNFSQPLFCWWGVIVGSRSWQGVVLARRSRLSFLAACIKQGIFAAPCASPHQHPRCHGKVSSCPIAPRLNTKLRDLCRYIQMYADLCRSVRIPFSAWIHRTCCWSDTVMKGR